MAHTLPKKVISLYPPVIIEREDGPYAVYAGVYYKVSKRFTLEQAYKHWERWQSTTASSAPTQRKTWKVANSKKNGYYTVSYDNGWSCTCTGYGYRRNCRHIEQTKSKV